MDDPQQFFFSLVCPSVLLFVLVVGVIGMVLALVFNAVRTYRRAADLLAQWAALNNYYIIKSDRRYIRKGPFVWTSSDNQIIYRVTVQDPSGNIRHGWVRCGSFLFGSWQNEVDVRWDDPAADQTSL